MWSFHLTFPYLVVLMTLGKSKDCKWRAACGICPRQDDEYYSASQYFDADFISYSCFQDLFAALTT
jgi:hypothetical protein